VENAPYKRSMLWKMLHTKGACCGKCSIQKEHVVENEDSSMDDEFEDTELSSRYKSRRGIISDALRSGKDVPISLDLEEIGDFGDAAFMDWMD